MFRWFISWILIFQLICTAAFAHVQSGGKDAKWDGIFAQGLLREGGQLTLGNVFEGALDGAITSGLSSAVYGTDFADGLRSSVLRNIVSLGLADVQTGIGNLGLGEGSPGHALLHGIAGCAFAELSGASCAAGAAAGIGQAIYAGAQLGNAPNPVADPEGYAIWRARVSDTSELIGAGVGFVFSGGDGENVSAGASVARSGFENNFLTHEEERLLTLAQKQIAEGCGEDEICLTNPDQVQQDLNNLDAARDLKLRQCVGSYTSSCVAARQELYKAVADYEEAEFLNPALLSNSNHTFFFSRTAQRYATYADLNDFDSDYWQLDPADYTAPNARRFASVNPEDNRKFAEVRSIPGTTIAAAEAGSGVANSSVLRLVNRLVIPHTVRTRNQTTDPRIDSADPRIQGKFKEPPKPGTLTTKEARVWYLEQESLIPSKLDSRAPLNLQARQAFELRNKARTKARELMSDRNSADALNRTDPNLTWPQVVQRYQQRGYSGDDLYRTIIDASQRSRTSVNKNLGLE